MNVPFPWSAEAHSGQGSHLGQFHRDLLVLTTRVRAILAEAVGRAVGGAARQTVLSLLGTPDADLRDPPLATELSGRPQALWRSRDEPEQWGDAHRADDPREWDLREDEGLLEEDRWLPPPQVREEPPPSAGSCRPTLVIALQAVAWWLWRQAGCWPVRAALGFGLACGLALYLSGAGNQTHSGLAPA